jgi:hypothetical protein
MENKVTEKEKAAMKEFLNQFYAIWLRYRNTPDIQDDAIMDDWWHRLVKDVDKASAHGKNIFPQEDQQMADLCLFALVETIELRNATTPEQKRSANGSLKHLVNQMGYTRLDKA